MAKFDSKTFNPEAFGKYVERIPNVKRNELAKSGALGANGNAREALATQTGSLYATVPYFGRISGSTSQNNTGAANITSSSTTTYEQGFVVASRMDAWTERSFSKNITAGVDFMDNVAAQIAEYKLEVLQGLMKSSLKGIFAMSTNVSGDTVGNAAATAFLAAHVTNIANESGTAAYVGATTLNTAMQKACGDNKDIFKLVWTDSTVATNLENLNLIDYLKYTDKDGITRDLAIGTWNGRIVLIDDDVPTISGYIDSTNSDPDALKVVASGASTGQINLADVTNYLGSKTLAANDYVKAVTAHTTYVLGQDALVVDPIGDSVPYEMSRDPATNGGQDTLYVRDRYIVGAEGLTYIKPSGVTASAANSDLENGAAWRVINDGTNAISTKAIPLAKIISLG